jgi:putative acyl-CoA dehydrogenase
MSREPDCVPALVEELRRVRGADRHLDAFMDRLTQELSDPTDVEHRARILVERIALALEGMLMVQHAPAASSAAFIRSRIVGDHGPGFGTLPS